jgi:PAS domain S-box-containing protein
MKANNLSKLSNLSLKRSAEVTPIAQGSKLESLIEFEVPSCPKCRTQAAAMEMVLPQVRDGIVVCDGEGLILLANSGAKRLAQQDLEGKTGHFAEDIWGALFDDNGSHMAAEEWPLTKALRGESIAYKECRLARRDGSTFDILFSASPIIDLARRIVGAVATLTDISQWKREDAIQREQSLERERSRMATHIHDTMSQSLTAITLQLQAAEREVQEGSHTAGVYLQRAITVARDTLADLRRCIWTLSHESLEGEDLAEALSFLAERLCTATPLKLELSLQPETRSLPREIRHEMLWISKEALANVLEHAEATTVSVELLCGEREVHLHIDDNGRGFGPRRLGANGSFGLISMRKRAQRLGGTVAVDSQLGRGTRVVAVVPCLQR